MSNDREIVCSRVVFVDSEFDAKKGQGERPGPPVCICAIEIDQDGRETEHRLAAPYPARAPWDRGDPFLTIGFALSAEAGSFLHVGWEFPLPAIDLYAEYMVIHNTEMSRGEGGKQSVNLIQACQRYRVAGMDKTYKEDMRSLAYTKTNHTPEEIALLQDYCIEDVRMLMRLYRAMRPHIDLLRAPIRGAFMMEIERIRWRGIPIDMPTYRLGEQRAPRSRSKDARGAKPQTRRRCLFSKRVQAEDHVSGHAAKRNPDSDRSEDGELQLCHETDQEHDRNISAVEALLRRQADD